MKSVQISRELFCYLVEYFFKGKDIITEELIKEQLEDKVIKMKRHSDYTKMKQTKDETDNIITSKDRIIIL